MPPDIQPTIDHAFEERLDDEKGTPVIGTRYPDKVVGPVCAVCGCLADEHREA